MRVLLFVFFIPTFVFGTKYTCEVKAGFFDGERWSKLQCRKSVEISKKAFEKNLLIGISDGECQSTGSVPLKIHAFAGYTDAGYFSSEGFVVYIEVAASVGQEEIRLGRARGNYSGYQHDYLNVSTDFNTGETRSGTMSLTCRD